MIVPDLIHLWLLEIATQYANISQYRNNDQLYNGLANLKRV